MDRKYKNNYTITAKWETLNLILFCVELVCDLTFHVMRGIFKDFLYDYCYRKKRKNKSFWYNIRKNKSFWYNKQNKTLLSGQYCIYEALGQVIIGPRAISLALGLYKSQYCPERSVLFFKYISFPIHFRMFAIF